MKAQGCKIFFGEVESPYTLEQVQGQVDGLLFWRVHDLVQERLDEAEPEALDLKDDLLGAGPKDLRQDKLVQGHLTSSAELKVNSARCYKRFT